MMASNSIVLLTKPLLLAIHERQLAEHGGRSGVRDETLLKSALARPERLLAYGDPAPDLADLAAALTFGLVHNHPFVDGNKRTAAVACETFINLNGGQITADDVELFSLFRTLAEGHLSAADFDAWWCAHGITAPGSQVHEPLRRTRLIAEAAS